MNSEGELTRRGVIYGIKKHGHRYIDNAEVIHRGWEYRLVKGSSMKVTLTRQIDETEAERLWKAQLEAAPKTETNATSMLVGVILPIWDRVEGSETIYRLQTDDGEQLLGRLLGKEAAKQTLKNLGLDSATAKLSPAELFAAIQAGQRAVLSNGWEISLATVNREDRIEVKGRLSDAEKRVLTQQGAFVERINWQERVFIPAGDVGLPVFERITVSKPVVDLFQKVRGNDTRESQPFSPADVDAALPTVQHDEPKVDVERPAPLPDGWTEAEPNGLLSNPDPIKGGIIDNEIVSVKWFAIPNNDAISKITDLNTRMDALEALAREVVLVTNQKENEPMADKTEKKSFAQVVAEKLVTQLKQGTAPWQRRWESAPAGSIFPMNPITGKRYRGINALHLISQNYLDQRWMTYKQAEAVGAQVRKGEKGTSVQYWKYSEEQDKLDDQGRPVRDANGQKVKETVQLERPRLIFATVFNGEQIDGLPPQQIKPKAEQQWEAIERAEHILKVSGAKITHAAGDRAFYRPSTDSITLPEKSQFESADRYYAAALHELGHWTGHPSRLDRDLAHPFGSEGYAKEELRAEISSMIVGVELGIGHDPEQHAAYVSSWIKALQNDHLEIFRASSDAEKIYDYVLAFEQKQVHEQDKSQVQDVAMPAVAQQQKAKSLTVVELTASQYEAAKAADEAFQRELVRAYGESNAGDDRYKISHDDQDVQTAADAFVAASKEWNEAVRVARETVSSQEAKMLADSPDQAASLLSSLPADVVQGIEQTASARQQLDVGEIDGQAFQKTAKEQLGIDLPADWNGRIQVQGNVTEDVDGKKHVTAAYSLGVEPEFWGVYVQLETGLHQWVADFDNEEKAQLLAERLRLVDALAEIDEKERGVKLAHVHEERVRRDPNSTDEDILAAKDARKAAEASAMLNDADLQRHIAELERNQQSQAQGAAAAPAPAQEKPERKYINVPYKEKDEAKGLGARWDRQQQSWYVPAGVDAALFAKWAQGAATPATDALSEATAPQTQAEGQKATQGRTYLAVPYAERGEAKAAGALWDKAAKSWYAGQRADMAKLERWNPEDVSPQQEPAMTPREEFAQAMRSAGLLVGQRPDGDHPIMDGKKHRVPVDGGKSGTLDGFYVGHLDGHPAGRIINNKTGTDIIWRSKGYALSDEEKAKLQAEAATKLAERAAEQEQQQKATAQRVGRQMASLTPIEQPTPYLEAKGIKPQAGALTDKDGQTTYIPAFDVDGKQWTMQYIQEDGTKRFAKDSKKEGCFHPVGGMDALAAAPALVISEGYATAAQVSEAIGHATVTAFDSGNLEAVAKALHAKFPDKPVIIAGDDDRHKVMTHGSNSGREKAEVAAQSVGGKAIFPIFAPSENTYPRDLPVITPDNYKTHLRAEQRLADIVAGKIELADDEVAMLKASMLSDTQIAALSTMKQHTDFNDLAHKSELGQGGVKRQINAAVGRVLIDVGQQEKVQKLDQAQKQEQRSRRAARIG
ncbi:Antirestriction protein ArdC [Nitrosomonas halophila]|uniref:Antirestriction protein ArdC n=2 Tax=Nitrosomonas halophila TaxID=44576 RepID=A0A1H3NYX4_9PROT|nr:Antirestriction protein ArdC [Nitrosomonas halophila]